MTKTLSKAEVERLMNQERLGARAVTWPKVEDLILLHEAVQEHSRVVKFSNGKAFLIRYETAFDNTIFVKPANGDYTPCGYFNKTFLKNAALGVRR